MFRSFPSPSRARTKSVRSLFQSKTTKKVANRKDRFFEQSNKDARLTTSSIDISATPLNDPSCQRQTASQRDKGQLSTTVIERSCALFQLFPVPAARVAHVSFCWLRNAAESCDRIAPPCRGPSNEHGRTRRNGHRGNETEPKSREGDEDARG